jgi:hypothetical protein
MKKTEDIKNIVRKSYGDIALSSCGCGGCSCNSNLKVQRQSGQLGYSEDEIEQVPNSSNLGLGCGNPIAIASLKEGGHSS